MARDQAPGTASGEATRCLLRAIHASPVGIAVSRTRDGRIVEVNEEFLRILGFTREEVVGRTSRELRLCTDSGECDAILQEHARTGDHTARPVAVRRKDGSLADVLLSASALSDGPEPMTVAWITDVTERRRAEERLRVSEERWRTLAENAPVAILTVDRTGRILTFNRSLVGRQASEVVGKSIHDFCLDDRQREEQTALLEKVFRDGATVAFEVDAATPSGGGRVRMRNVIAPLRSPGGGIEAAIGVGMDVTPVHEALERLRASEGRWRSLVENAPAVVTIVNRDGTVLSVNQTVTRRPRSEVEGGNAFSFLPAEARDEARALLERVFSSGAPVAFRGPVYGPAGDLRWFEHRLAPVRAHGAVDAVIALSNDITAQVQTETALRESEQRFRDIVQSMGDWVWEVDASDRLVYTSPQVEALLGYTAAEMLGKSPWDTCVPEERRRLLEGQRQLQEKPAAFRDREIWHVHRDGRRVCLSVSGVPVFDAGGRLQGFRGVAHDVTERRREEEERRRLEDEVQQARRVESLGVLAGGIAHDFNNVLTAILGNAELALGDLPPGAPTRPLIEQIQAAGQHAAELTRQMLAYAGRSRLAAEPVDLSRAVREMEHLLRASVPKKVRLDLELADGLPAVVADPAQLQQVVMNLVINGADAIGEGEGRVVVRTSSGAPPEGFRGDLTLGAIPEGTRQVCIDIVDTGAGIPRDTLPKIFDPFFTTKFAGRGLGLAAVQGNVLRHGGSVSVSSDVGRGATFRVCLPALGEGASPPAAEAPRPSPGREEGGWRGSGTVLVVDDEEPVRFMMTRMLKALGFETEAAADGREALRAVAAQPGLRAVLLDLMMPHMDGRETFRELRRLRADLPVILCSGYDVLEGRERFPGLDFSGYLQKPYRMEDVARRLRCALGE